MKALLQEFDGSIVLGLLERVCADRFAFFGLFFVHLHGEMILWLFLLLSLKLSIVNCWVDCSF
jgi:hypothetical protein